MTLLGRVGGDPVARGSLDHPVTMFQLATSYSIKKMPEDSVSPVQYEQRTEWHRIAVFRKGLRDIAATILNKGDRVYLTGTIEYSSFKDNTTGQTIYSTSIVAGL